MRNVLKIYMWQEHKTLIFLWKQKWLGKFISKLKLCIEIKHFDNDNTCEYLKNLRILLKRGLKPDWKQSRVRELTTLQIEHKNQIKYGGESQTKMLLNMIE